MSTRRAFTLLELLIAVLIVMVLMSLVAAGLWAARQRADAAREMAAARQLMVGFVSYATDHEGRLLPGYFTGPGLVARDEAGNDLHNVGGPVTARYPWRLAPYLDYDLHGLYLDERVLETLNNRELRPYLISLYPSLGMNAMFVGGDGRSEGLAFNPLYERIFGRFYVTRLSQPKRPAELIVFASARTDTPWGPDSPPLIEGHHIIEPPFTTERQWADSYGPDEAPSAFGHISLRHHDDAAIGFFDGHTGTLDEGRIQNMRYWADQADAPDWTLKPQS